jgi:uncharacterized protein (DUF1697 family)
VTPSARWLALLRAVNLAGDTTVRMAPLRDALAGAGFGEVRTYLQSGNVILTSPLASADAVARSIETVIEDAFGLGVDVLVRTPEEVREVLARIPFGPEAEPRHVVVHFLAEILGPDGAAELAAWDGPELVDTGWPRGVRAVPGGHRPVALRALRHLPALARCGHGAQPVDGARRRRPAATPRLIRSRPVTPQDNGPGPRGHDPGRQGRRRGPRPRRPALRTPS